MNLNLHHVILRSTWPAGSELVWLHTITHTVCTASILEPQWKENYCRKIKVLVCLPFWRLVTGVRISPYPDKEGNKLQQQKILSFMYPICNHNWRNISAIYIYNKTSIKRNILTIKQNTSGSRSGEGLISTPVLCCVLFLVYFSLKLFTF
jgi:hypothetical protein